MCYLKLARGEEKEAKLKGNKYIEYTSKNLTNQGQPSSEMYDQFSQPPTRQTNSESFTLNLDILFESNEIIENSKIVLPTPQTLE